MSEDILFELYVFCEALIHGVLLTIAYDVVRIFRRIIKRNTFMVSLEDFVLSIIGAFITFNMVYQENNGNIRGYIFVGMLVGMGLYLISISRIFVNTTSKCVLILLQKVIKVFKINERKVISKVRISREKDNCKKNETIK